MIRNRKTYEEVQTQQINVLEPRAHEYTNELEEGNLISLNGKWHFKLFASPTYIDLEKELTSDLEYAKIIVPSAWQSQGFGQMQYINVEWSFPIRAPHVPAMNPTGVYKRKFIIDKKREKDYILRFEGVDSCFRVFVNSKEVGMSKGSRYVTEFLVNDLIKAGQNNLMVIVYKYSDGTYLEDQDQWQFSGIYRDVSIIIQDKGRIWDAFFLPIRINKNEYELELKYDFAKSANVIVKIEDLFSNEKILEQAIHSNQDGPTKCSFRLKNVREWNAETPFLYKATLSYVVNGKENKNVYRFGFREIAIKNRTLLLNNKPIIIKGVNYHSFDPKTGKYSTKEQIKAHLIQMKQHNINAIRTSHYPQTDHFYDLCDEMGFYVMSEADVESHGFNRCDNFSLLSEDVRFQLAFELRGTRMVHRYKNHPSIIFWSLGNETGTGPNIDNMSAKMKAIDRSRLYHFETERELKNADIHSSMYSHVVDTDFIEGANKKRSLTLLDFVKGEFNGKKHRSWLNVPHIECEFAHAMGNGPGSIKDFFDAFYKYPCLSGGFIWEWWSHGIESYDAKAPIYKKYYKYGGDFGERPHDGETCIDGLVFPDGTPTPGLKDYKEVIAPLIASVEKNVFVLKNRYDFLNSNHLELEMLVIDSLGQEHHSEKINIAGLNPGDQLKIDVSKYIPRSSDLNFYLKAQVRAKSSSGFFKYQKIIAKTSHKLKVARQKRIEPKLMPHDFIFNENKFSYELRDANFKYIFDKASGQISIFDNNHNCILYGGPRTVFWRAYIDNDRHIQSEWQERYRLNYLTESLESIKHTHQNEKHVFKVETVVGGANQFWNYRVFYEYSFWASGHFSLVWKGKPEGILKWDPNKTIFKMPALPRFIPRIAMAFKVSETINQVKYFGKGPGPTYSDLNNANSHGLWKLSIDDLFTNFVRPQENGNRHKVDWAEVYSNKASLKISGLHFNNHFDFNYSHFNTQKLDEARHQNELIKDDYNSLYINYKQSGLGSGSVGPSQLDNHRCRVKPFKLKLAIQLKSLK